MAEPAQPSPQNPQNFYEILGVSKDATQDEIKNAFRSKARLLHPDVNHDDPHATEKFQQLNEAYSILKDPKTREQYDRFTLNGEEPQTQEEIDQFELFTQILGLGRSRTKPKGNKVSPTIRLLKVTLDRIYNGGTMTVFETLNVICPTCHGIGSNDGIEYPECPECHGSGNAPGQGIETLFPCHHCSSIGYIIPIEKRCPKCFGRKLIHDRKRFDFNIEIGTQDHEQIIIPNAGDQYPGKEPADIIFITVTNYDNNFIRDGDDLIFVKKLSIPEIKYGTAFQIDTLDHRKLHVGTPEGQPIDCSKVKWIKGEGLPTKGNSQFKGNLYIILQMGFPGLITQGVRLVSSLIHKSSTNIILEDAPEELFKQRDQDQQQQA